MRHEFIPNPLTRESLQVPPPLEGAPAAGAPGTHSLRPPPPENASRIEQLVHLLDSEDWTVCTDAQSELARMGSDPVDTLCDVLKTGSWNARWRAAWILGRIADISAVEPLCEALKDRYGYSWKANLHSFAPAEPAPGRALVPTASREQRALLRMEAAEALGRIGEPEAVPVLCGALSDSFDRVQERASTALAQIGAEAFDALLEVVDGPGTEPRVWAVRALVRMGDAAAIPVLIGLLEDRHGSVRVEAAEGLAVLAVLHPILELRSALPLLRRLLSPWALLSTGDQATFSVAVDVIERSTASLRDLPLPAVSSTSAIDTLPLPARPHSAGTAELPLPSRGPAQASDAPKSSPGAVRKMARWLRERLR